MTLLIRSLQTVIRDRWRKKIIDLNTPSVEKYRVWLIDIDVYRHMNHAKYLNYLEAARWGMMVRLGFLKLSFKKKWITPIRTLNITYYRPLILNQKFEIHSQFLGFEEKWFYIIQRFWSEDKEIARAYIKGTVRKGRKNIPPSEYLPALGFSEQGLQVSEELIQGFMNIKKEDKGE